MHYAAWSTYTSDVDLALRPVSEWNQYLACYRAFLKKQQSGIAGRRNARNKSREKLKRLRELSAMLKK